MNSIGVDIGGTKCKIGLIDKSNVVIKKYIDTPKTGIKDVVLEISKVIDEIVIDNEISNIGIGIRGTFKDGLLTDPILNANNEDIKGLFSEYFPNTNISVINDASAAAVAEMKYGNLKDVSSGILLTLGTGIGGGIIISGKLFEGANKNAGEIGKMMIDLNDFDEYNEARNTYESLASTSALVNRVKLMVQKGMLDSSSEIIKECNGNIEQLNAQSIFNAYDKGDELARSIINEHLKYITSGIINLIMIFDLEMVVIGGGISKREDIVIEGIKKIIKDKNLTNLNSCNIVSSKFYNDAGIIGAANFIV